MNRFKWNKVTVKDNLRGEDGVLQIEELDASDYDKLIASLRAGSDPLTDDTATNKKKRKKAQLKKEQPQSVEISETNNKTESPVNKESSNDAVDNASSKQKKKRKRRRKNKQTDASAASAEVNEKEEAAKEEQEQEQEQEREGEEEEQEIESALPIEDDSDVAEDQEKPATKYNHAVLHPTPTVAEWRRKFGRLKSWAEYQLHPLLMQSLKEAKFFSPTPIQQRCLRVALKEEMDVIGVAETGSGKTLAYGLPILHKLLKRRAEEWRQKKAESPEEQNITINNTHLRALIITPTRELAIQVADHMKLLAKHTDIQIVTIIGGMSTEKQVRLLKRRPEVVIATPGRFWELVNEGQDYLADLSGVKYLVVDEADRMVESGHFRELKMIANLLRNPSRASDVSEEASKVPAITEDASIEVKEEQEEEELIDESELYGYEEDPEIKEEEDGDADGQQEMDESDIKEEKEEVVEVEEEEEEEEKEHNKKGNEVQKPKRQTFVFSATLTIARKGREKVNPKDNKKGRKINANAIGQVTKLIGFERPKKVVDLTTKKIVVSTLEEAAINCLTEEKDYYLYYFLTRHEGRTLVFVNSIACIRRLVPLLALLRITTWPLHAQMQQRQRLKNLERFRENKVGVLLATDVAARGLDIPLVDHVVHYQLPRTTELYVHRSGRTARASASGLSVTLVGPEDVTAYKKICQVLRAGTELSAFNVDRGYLPGIAKRVNLARKLDSLEHQMRKKQTNKNWLIRNAQEMDIDIDDDLLSSDDEEHMDQHQKQKREINNIRNQLNTLLNKPLLPRGGFTTFFTRSLFYDDPKQVTQELAKHEATVAKQPKGGKKRKHKKRR